MKKLLVLALLFVGSLFATTDVNAQYGQNREYRREQRQENREYRREQRRYENSYDRFIVRNEQRYVRVGRRVFREVYRSTYTRRGVLVNRVLVSRERVSRYDNRDERYLRNEGIRFGIYLNF